MTTEGAAAAAPEPAKEPATNATPSTGKSSATKAKRLLPMELRVRGAALICRAAGFTRSRGFDSGSSNTCQVRKLRGGRYCVRAYLKYYLRLLIFPRCNSKPTDRDNDASNQEGDTHEAAQEKAVDTAVLSSAPAVKKSSAPTQMRQSPLDTTAAPTPLNRLQSLYALSSLSLQRQRQRRRAGANRSKYVGLDALYFDQNCAKKHHVKNVVTTSSKMKQKALQRFITRDNYSIQHTGSLDAAVRWHEALHYFVYPAAPVPTSILLNRATAASTSEPLLGGPKGERKREDKAFFTARWNTWQEGFRDVYMNFRRQSTGTSTDTSFYLRSSDFVVSFIYDTGAAKTEGSSPSIINLCQEHVNDTESSDEMERESERTAPAKKCKLYAVMSQSNGRIRKVLHHLNVEYSMPYVNANQTEREAGEFHLLEEEQEASKSRNQNASGGGVIAPVTRAAQFQENMHGADSLLLFHGHDAVHGLYEFLINRAPMSNQDVPEIFALHPFANATIQRLQVTLHGRVGGFAAGPLSDDQQSRTGATLFRTEVVGFCFPSSIETLLGVLKDEWESVKSSAAPQSNEDPATKGQEPAVAMRTYMEAVPGAERLNAARLDKRGDQQQRQKRQQALEFSKRRMEVVVVTKLEDRYVVETTTRPIAVKR
ncbi:unnamed protein product [Phytophthora fragariaefolia]|uniref:Unnamed protein product n=1 Tax=Phytophthora fragariaefolia TaxID=1490495 RepID=A0A9W6XWM0_9STRA|nr:unnamed protein product [Phytophthora fragariaefolia]